MANLSEACGKVTIKKEGNKMSLQLLKKIFKEIGTYYYGNLLISDELEFDVALNFVTFGRWSFTYTLEDYFEGFDLNNFSKQELENISGLIFDFDYTDYEPGCELFEEGNIVIKAVFKNDKLKTEIIKEKSYPIDISAKNLEDYFICDDAFDTFTEYGVNNFKKVLKDEIDLYEDKKLVEMSKKLLEMSTKEIIEFFNHNEMVACDNCEDVSWVVENVLDSVTVES
ncbi:hypothetical protein [Finegoldia magna]|uniref:Uncharacterized protein n=1 Tax=Finegoldia magna (strain ATCC 29328 / DSM 20472 / WAL 2508) TaxID=334413 RepID=B0S494_FINM2|nr:hypothetical protein [Finegoldia magna]UEA71236.1 hypothetical protein LK415_08970 [Finegoldia magna]BAG09085.1 hypothetical protein FMG_P0036 [Finegoldia magna ATCC 29328]